jgi:hypothetical protein
METIPQLLAAQPLLLMVVVTGQGQVKLVMQEVLAVVVMVDTQPQAQEHQVKALRVVQDTQMRLLMALAVQVAVQVLCPVMPHQQG